MIRVCLVIPRYSCLICNFQWRRGSLDEAKSLVCARSFLSAGTDTTSTALEWLMANLVKYPKIQEKVFEEIKGVVGNGQREVKEDDLQKMTYLKAFILESLRRHPPAHFVVWGGIQREQRDKDDAVWGWEEDLSWSCLAMLHLEYFVANLIWCYQWKAVDEMRFVWKKRNGSASNIRDYGGRTPSTEADSQGRRRNANMERMKKGSEGGIIEDFGIQKIGERSLKDPDTMAAQVGKNLNVAILENRKGKKVGTADIPSQSSEYQNLSGDDHNEDLLLYDMVLRQRIGVQVHMTVAAVDLFLDATDLPLEVHSCV
ncbi:hypothetical protein JRO89_XS04G0075700 [Xanthoceras sorbifolium]|uniref:Cytochrome P450 n=1 Tax=Xanthoceras sorbifolium TaxID=99658 RepID=A0ABQ8I4H7_9ROSI|nr:hypothetical protein JRO89_XS04G0075700 [Xanthoceras sorbifolium]